VVQENQKEKDLKKEKNNKHIMRFLNIIILAAFISFAILSDLYAVIGYNNPKIVFNETLFDFGDVEREVELKYAFKFENQGKGILIISNVKASCGCTGVILDNKKNFEEGGTGEIKIVFNTQGKYGTQIKTVSVYSNDPVRPNIVLTIKCNIKNGN